MSVAAFQQLFDYFMTNVNQFNTEERKLIFVDAKQALSQILHSHNDAKGPIADCTEVELIIGERMFQTGAAKSVFTKYDQAGIGALSKGHFQAAIQDIGISLSPDEVNSVMQTHGSDRGDIDYESFIRAIIGQRNSESQTPHTIARIQELVKSRTTRRSNMQTSTTIAAPPSNTGDQPAVVQVLVKMNNMNLRKIFKEMDDDNDGLVSTAQLAHGLIQQGLSSAVANSPQFAAFVETFAKRKKGHFGYAEFVRFVNNRAGMADETVAALTCDPTLTLPEVVRFLHENTKRVSVSNAFKNFDKSGDDKLNAEEFQAAMISIGFNFTPEQIGQLFAAFDHHGDGVIDLYEFGKCLVNPNQNPKLGVTNHRHAAGGESTLFSDGLSTKSPKQSQSKKTTKIPPGGASNVNFSEENPVDLSEGRVVVNTNSFRSSVNFTEANLPGDQEVVTDGRKYSDAKFVSTIDFAKDHGASENRQEGDVRVGVFQSVINLTHDGDQSARINKHARAQQEIPQSPGGNAVVNLTHSDQPIPSPVKPRGPVGGSTNVSFNQADKELKKTSYKVCQTPGGTSKIDLTMDHSNAADLSNGVNRGTAGGESTWSHDDDMKGGAVRRSSTSVTQSPGGNSSVTFSNPTSQASGILRDISDAIYNRGRLRHTFQEFNSSKDNNVLTKTDLKSGLETLRVHVSDDDLENIYERFDKNKDGSLTYSEFVRMLATKG